MSLSLLDSNVWVSLAIDRHKHHRHAVDWFGKASDDASTCFCRMTQNSFLRLLTLKALFEEDTLTNNQANSLPAVAPGSKSRLAGRA
jgi:predicted nucleic acid-binding protein